MASLMDQIVSPCLPSPLANSTKIINSASGDGFHRKSSLRQSISIRPNSTTNSVTFKESVAKGNVRVNHISSIHITISSPDGSTERRKSVSGKKPVVTRKITSKTTTEPIKAIAHNNKNNSVTVENILKQINMTKYRQSFKKINVAKFKELKEIDLNAIGITRPSEIKVFMEAIKNTKSDFKS